jgi:hypothetical protein
MSLFSLILRSQALIIDGVHPGLPHFLAAIAVFVNLSHSSA